MNKENRSELNKAIDLINEAKAIIESVKDGEQDKFDNLSEGLQQTENGQKFEEIVSVLDDALNELESACDNINQAAE